MCGFSGMLFTSRRQIAQVFCSVLPDQNPQNLREHFARYGQLLAHRGGDDYREAEGENYWICHHRLAFQDVPNGQQPAESSSGKSLMVFNGEIYNHFALRQELTQKKTMTFANRSDTLTLVEAHEYWKEKVNKHLEGEYAFAVLEDGGKSLHAYRDPYGVKPLYFYLRDVDTSQFANAQKTYTFNTNCIGFASEIKGLPIKKQWLKEGFLRQYTGLYEPLRTPFKNIIQLPAGASLLAVRQGQTYHVTIQLNTQPMRRITVPHAKAQSAPSGRFSFAEKDWEGDFRGLLADSVRERLLSDIELGVYLSGGIDSKVVGYELAQAARNNNKKVKSFTVGFFAEGFDETAEVLKYCAAYNFSPHILKLNNEHLNYSYPVAVYHSENVQPYTNGAAKWWLSRFTRQHVHGVLTGDGADEVLCGYPSFRYVNWWKFACRTLVKEKDKFRDFTTYPLGSSWRDSVYYKRFASHTQNPWVAGSSSAGLGQDFLKSLEFWGVVHPLFSQIQAIAQTLFSTKKEADEWLISQRNSIQSWFAFGGDAHSDLTDPENSLALWQNYFCLTHLPVQVLNWVGDRMEMANTLEGRTPFLSKKIRDFVFKLPDVAMVAGFQDKAILRRAYSTALGKFSKTPKKQFGAPFLDNTNLLKQYNFRYPLEQCGLDADLIFSRLDNPIAKEETKTHDSHNLVHLQSSLQTLVSAAIVHDTLVMENPVIRDKAYEENICKKLCH